MNSTTHIPEIRRLQRSRSDRKVAGVSGGLAQYFEIHPAIFRVGFVVLTLLGGAGLLIYAAAALVMPDEGKEDSIATAALRNRRDRPWPVIGLGFLAVAGAILLSRVSLSLNGGSWFLFLVAGIVILWITRQPAADRAADPSIDPTTDPGAVPASSRRSSRSETPGACGGSASGSRSRSRRSSPSCSSPSPPSSRCSTSTSAAASATATSRSRASRTCRSDYHLGIGTLDLDLRELKLPLGETHVEANVDVGDLHVIVAGRRRPAGARNGRDRRGRSPRRRRRRRPQRRERRGRDRAPRARDRRRTPALGSVRVERAATMTRHVAIQLRTEH